MSNSTQPDKPTGLLDPHAAALIAQLENLDLPSEEVILHDPHAEAIIAELENLVLPSEDGIPLESNWHRLCMNMLIECVIVHMGARTDYFVGGNMFVYYSIEQVRNRDFRGPDFFFVADSSLTPLRESWVTWNENGRYPDAIIELSSPSTAEVDRNEKFRIYEQVFRTSDYFIYDPANETLEGWHLVNSRYEPLAPNEHGRLWCSALQLWVGVWRGMHLAYNTAWLRFFDNAGNVVPTPSELERRGKEEEQRRADEEQRRADEERRGKEEEQRRADAAEAEVARLRELLARHETDAGQPPPG